MAGKYPKLGDGIDYGMCPPPTEAQIAFDWVVSKVLGSKYCTIFPLSKRQYNTQASLDIVDAFERTCCSRNCPFRKSSKTIEVSEEDFVRFV